MKSLYNNTGPNEATIPNNAEVASFDLALARSIVADDLRVDAVQAASNKTPTRLFGRLQHNSAEVFPRWLDAFQQRGYTPRLHRNPDAASDEDVILEVLPIRIQPTSSNLWIHALLFLLTVMSTLLAGMFYGIDIDEIGLGPEDGLVDVYLRVITTPSLLVLGVPFAATLLGILAAHEFGHYFAARYHKVAVTLPYFIPMPFSFLGTLGAVIRMKAPIPDRRKLFDIGVAGPLAGLVLAVPLLLYGLATSEVQVPPPSLLEEGTIMLEGNSLLYYWAKVLVHGKVLPNPLTAEDVLMNDIAFAAWIGLLVTALNLLPLGQLDGGHTVFSLFGRRARPINLIAMGMMLVLALAGVQEVQRLLPWLVNIGWSGWFVWLVLITLMGGPFHPPALDDVTNLDPIRRWLGYFVILVFILTFVPVPLRPL